MLPGLSQALCLYFVPKFSSETWIFFDPIKCSFHKCKNRVSRGKAQMKYLKDTFLTDTTSWNFLEDMERKLDRFEKSTSAHLGDAEREESFEVHNLNTEEVKTSGAGKVESLILG